MPEVVSTTRVSLKNILFLTDFSEPCTAALPFAISIARAYHAALRVLHVSQTSPFVCTAPDGTFADVQAKEKNAKVSMQRIESQLGTLRHDVTLQDGYGVWQTAQQTIENQNTDLIVLGTHGRTGVKRR